MTTIEDRLDDARGRLDRLTGEITQLGELDQRSPGQESRLERQIAAHGRLQADVIEMEREFRSQQVATVRDGLANGSIRTEHGDGATAGAPIYGSATAGPTGPLRSAAMRVVDGHVRSGQLPAYAAERLEPLFSLGPAAERSFAARWVQTTGSDAYRDAFSKWFLNPTQGHLLWTEQERTAWQAVQGMRAEQRAMSLTDASGGYGTLPYQLDPTVILDNAGTVNPLRQVSRIETTVTDRWRAVTSAGATASWDAEAAEVSDDTPTLAQPEIPVHRLQTFIPFSRELEEDWAGPALTTELAKILTDAAERLMSTGYTVGTGSAQPKGVITDVAADAGSLVTPATAEVFASADVYATIEALPARWRGNARWMANLNVINDIDLFETPNGAKLFPQVGNDNPILLRRPLHENSEMDGTWNVTQTANNYILLVGDFREFVVVDKAFSATVEVIPHLFGSANRFPTGQRGAYLYLRTGSGCTVTDAFRLLNLATTA